MAKVTVELDFPDLTGEELKAYVLKQLQADDPHTSIEEVNAYVIVGMHYMGELEYMTKQHVEITGDIEG